MSDKDTVPLHGKRKPKLFYGYTIVIVCFLMMVIMHGTYNSFGVFFTPLETFFGTSRAVLSGASSVAFVVMGVSAMLLGILYDKFGPRLAMTAFGILFGAGYMLMSQATQIWHVYLYLSLAGIGLSASDVIPMASVVRWFVKKRGMLSGVMKVGTGVGMMTAPIVCSLLIDSIGWQQSYLLLGLAVLVIVIPLSQFLKRDPREMGLLPDGEAVTAERPILLFEEGLTFQQALKTKQLWMICAFYIVLVYCGMTNLTHIVPYAEGIGIVKTAAASVISVYGFSSMFGRIAAGLLGDRLGHKQAMIICFIIAITGLTWLQFSGTLWMLYLFAAIYGFSHGGFFSIISPFLASLFGIRSQGSILGVVIFFGTVGGSIGMTLSGFIFDVTGTYRIAFLIMLALIISGLVILTMVKPITATGSDEK